MPKPDSFGQVEVVHVGLEALVEPPLAVEDVGADDGARPETLALQHGGQRQLVRRQEEAAVVAHAVFRREAAREDAGSGPAA